MIAQIEGIERVRLSSIEALELTDEFLDGLLKIKSFCTIFTYRFKADVIRCSNE
jgi:threonylcarbamoyladenosine tRNA methylthiotransferase MtaB